MSKKENERNAQMRSMMTATRTIVRRTGNPHDAERCPSQPKDTLTVS